LWLESIVFQFFGKKEQEGMKVKWWQALLVIVVFGALLVAIANAGAKWRQYQAVGLMRVSQEGELYVRIANQIYRYRPDGEYQGAIDLSRWGIDWATGGFDIFSNGDILMLEGSHRQSVFHKVMVWLRLDKLLPGAEPDDDGVRLLVRCSPQSGKCQKLPGFHRSFTNTFRVLIDDKQRIFLADTQNDRLSLLAEDGTILDEVTSGFRFPNQMALDGNKLVLANTNFNELTVIPLTENGFAEKGVWKHITVDLEIVRFAGPRTGHVWPLEVVVTEDHYYALQQSDGMAKGAVVRYTRDGKYAPPRFVMPEDSDAMSLVAFDNGFLVADSGPMRILRYNADGTLQGEFGTAPMTRELDRMAVEKEFYRALEKQLWVAFAVLLVLGLVGAWLLEQRHKDKKDEQAFGESLATTGTLKQQQNPSPKPSVDDPGIHWIARNEDMLRKQKLLMWILFPILLLMDLMVVGSEFAKPESRLFSVEMIFGSIGITVILLLFFLGFFLMISRFQKMQIGVLREWVILRGLTGMVAIGSGAEIEALSNGLRIGEVAVPTGPIAGGEFTDKSLFDQHELQQWLWPRICHAKKSGGLAEIRREFQKHPYRTTAVVVLIVVLLLV
jgi:uncharacterized membrane protein YsdA (DUF1294 family)